MDDKSNFNAQRDGGAVYASKQIAEGMEELLLKAFDFCKHEQAYMPQLPEESHRKLADLIYELIVYEG